jgi:hypothetical protein
MKRAIGVIFAVSALFSGNSSFAAGPFGTIHVGNWSGGAYTEDSNGTFTHCAAATSYANGVLVIVTYNVRNEWILGFVSPNFHLTKGETFPIDITFDGQSQVRLFGVAINDQLVSAIMVPNALRDFKKASLMVAVARGGTFQFNLNTTGTLLAVISNCVAKVKATGVNNAGDFAIVSPPKPPVVAKPVATNHSPQPRTTQNLRS